MTETGARRLNEDAKEERRRRFLELRERFLRESPGMNPFKLIAREERVTVWTVYSVIHGRR
jgi:hypothetical protein